MQQEKQQEKQQNSLKRKLEHVYPNNSQQDNEQEQDNNNSVKNEDAAAQPQEQQQQQRKKRDRSKFHFKGFVLHHELCAMKVGTDGLILAGYGASLVKDPSKQQQENEIWPRQVLEIGTGSGLISILLALHYPHAQFHSIDIDQGAITQATQNLHSQQEKLKDLHKRIQLQHVSMQQFYNQNVLTTTNNETQQTKQPNKVYDLVMCAPPYFMENSLSELTAKQLSKKRKIARHLIREESMTLQELFLTAGTFLKPETGRFCFVFPSTIHVEQHSTIEKILADNGMCIVQLLKIRDHKDAPVIRHIYQCKKLASSVAAPPADCKPVVAEEAQEQASGSSSSNSAATGDEESKNNNNNNSKTPTSYEIVEFCIYAHAQPKELQNVKRKYSPEYIELLQEFCDHMFRT